jgi:hypothetical protein
MRIGSDLGHRLSAGVGRGPIIGTNYGTPRQQPRSLKVDSIESHSNLASDLSGKPKCLGLSVGDSVRSALADSEQG